MEPFDADMLADVEAGTGRPGLGACPSMTQPPKKPAKLAVAIIILKPVFDFFAAISHFLQKYCATITARTDSVH